MHALKDEKSQVAFGDFNLFKNLKRVYQYHQANDKRSAFAISLVAAQRAIYGAGQDEILSSRSIQFQHFGPRSDHVLNVTEISSLRPFYYLFYVCGIQAVQLWFKKKRMIR